MSMLWVRFHIEAEHRVTKSPKISSSVRRSSGTVSYHRSLP